MSGEKAIMKCDKAVLELKTRLNSIDPSGSPFSAFRYARCVDLAERILPSLEDETRFKFMLKMFGRQLKVMTDDLSVGKTPKHNADMQQIRSILFDLIAQIEAQ